MNATVLEICGNEGKLNPVTSGGLATGFVENETYQLRVCGRCDTLLIDDIPLDRLNDGDTFSWKPGFFAGRVSAETTDSDGRTLDVFTLDVGAAPHKLGQPGFQRMVDELFKFRPDLLLGAESAQSPFNHNGSHDTLEVEYTRLRRYGASCVRALQLVCAAPLTSLRPDRRIVLPHQARRMDTTAIRGLARSPAGPAILKNEHADANAYAHCRISVPYAERTFNNAANRAMAATVDRLLSRSETVLKKLAVAANATDAPIAQKMPRRMEVLRALRNELRRVRRSRVLSAVTRPEFTAAGLNAISAQPGYAHAFQLAWKALRTGIKGDDASDELPLSPTWEIYERWCFLQVTKVLERSWPDTRWKLRVGSSVDAIRVDGKVGDAIISVRLQARFGAWDVSSEASFRSLSGERSPDIVVTLESPRGRRFLVLDAKYRAKRWNVLDAMQSAHVYRDSLLWGDVRPWMSLLLIPKRGDAVWLEDLSFHEQFKVGVMEMAKSDATQQIEHLLERFFAAER